MNIPRKHHFIPAFYLRRWCNPSDKLVEYSMKYRKLISKSVGPESTGFEFDLYTFNDLPPQQRQFIEHEFFGYADQKAADALGLLHTGENKWSNELVSAWSRFVIALYLRHPDAMPEIRAATKKLWEESGLTFQERYLALKQPEDPETFDDYLALRDPLATVKASVNLVIAIFDNPKIGSHVNGMKNEIVDVSKSSRRFLISDRPVGMFDIQNKRDGMITLPISPTKLWVSANNQEIFDRIRAADTDNIVKHVNAHVVERARRFVWSSDDSQERFIRNRMSTKLEKTPFFPNLSRHYDTAPPSLSNLMA